VYSIEHLDLDDSLGNGDDTIPQELIHFVTQQTRFALVNNILQHPEQFPTMYELEEHNRDRAISA
jgi:hypothetical protein